MGAEMTAISTENIKSHWMKFEEDASVVGITPIVQGILSEYGLWSSNVDVRSLASAIEQIPAKPYIFEGTQEGIQAFLSNSDRFVIWTQGESDLQRNKFNTSGLAQITDQHSSLFDFISSADKLPLLTAGGDNNIIRKFAPDNRPVFILDDKAANVYRATQEIQIAQDTGLLAPNDVQPITVAWMRHPNGRSRNKVPQNYTSVDEFMSEHIAVESLPEFYAVRKSMHPDSQVTVLCDWDHTLFWTAAWREEAYGAVLNAITNN